MIINSSKTFKYILVFPIGLKIHLLIICDLRKYYEERIKQDWSIILFKSSGNLGSYGSISYILAYLKKNKVFDRLDI